MLHIFIRKFDKILESSKIFAVRIANIKGEIVKPKTFYQGEQFETFVEENLFPESLYTLVKRTDTFERNYKRFSESTNDPDFLFRCKLTNKEFAVEAKYRTNLNKEGQLSWAKMYQKERYELIDKNNIPVFIAVGLGGVSNKPNKIYLFPVRGIKYIHLNMDKAQKYELPAGQLKGIDSSFLWNLVKRLR